MNDTSNSFYEEAYLGALSEIDENECRKLLKKNLGFFSLIPLGLKRVEIFNNCKCYYIPFRKYNFSVSGEVIFKANNILKKWEDKKYKYKEVDEFKTIYNCLFSYENVLESESSFIDEGTLTKLEPFDLNKLVNINTDKLISQSDISEEEILQKSQNKIIKNAIKQAKKYDRHSEIVEVLNNLVVKTESQEKIFLPIWICKFNYKEKEYSLLINGQTGKTVGELPKSKFKFLILFILIFLLIFLITFLIAYFI